MPSSAPASASVTLSTCPDGDAKSTSEDTSVPTAPAGAPASSRTAAPAGVLVASSTGASFTGVTSNVAVSVAVEKAVVPPLTDVSAVPPFVPVLRSQARNVSAATGLVRCKMSEVEQTLRQEGFQELDQTESGPCCDGVEDAKFSCAWRVEKLELPEEQLGQLDLDSGLDLGGEGEASGPSASKGRSGPDLAEVGAAASGTGVAGIMSLMSKGKSGGENEIGDVACFLLSDDASYLNGQVVAVDGGATVR